MRRPARGPVEEIIQGTRDGVRRTTTETAEVPVVLNEAGTLLEGTLITPTQFSRPVLLAAHEWNVKSYSQVGL